MSIKKYISVVSLLICMLIVGGIAINILVSNMTSIFSLLLGSIIIISIFLIIFSLYITNRVIKNKNINYKLMKFNFSIVSLLLPIMTPIGKIVGVDKNELRKIFIKLNNEYIYSQEYNLLPEDIIILIPHCIQKYTCKLKVTTKIETCAKCGLCNIGDLVKLKEKTDVKIFVATGGTLARKIILENRPKAVIAVACERDLTSGVQDTKGIPVLGVFNKRPNGPCVDTIIDIDEVEKAINFFIK